MTRDFYLPLLASVLTALLAGGCGQGQQAAPKANAAGAAQPAAVPFPPALSPVECSRFAKGLSRAIDSGKLNRVNDMFNWPALLGRATTGIDAPPALQKQFVERGLQAAHEETGFSGKLVQAVKDGTTLKFLRVHDVDRARRVLFRMVRKDREVGYLDFVLGEDTFSHPRIVDVDPVQDGQLLSQTIREAYLQTLVSEQPKVVALLAGDDRLFAEAAPQLARVAGFRKAGKFSQAMEAFEELPREVRARKAFQRLHVAVARGIDEKQFAAALEEFRSHFPGDPSVDLLSADDFIRTRQFDKAAACIHRLDGQVNDPYLDVVLAQLYLQAGQPEAARRAADEAIRRAPRELDSYQARLSVSLAEKKFADTARLLHFIGTHFDAQFHDLKTLPAYAAFVKSPEYDAWLKAQAEVRKQANSK